MRVPISWLAEMVADLPPPEVIAERLTMAGLEVEALERPVADMGTGLVVAHIEEVSKHPNADRLSVCRVDDGEAVRQVVCGASNMKDGDFVVLAKPGVLLPGGIKIKAARLRGVESEGMLCAAEEIGLSASEDGILILSNDVAAGTAAAPVLGLDDTVVELSITPNRGDCLSVRGLARELSAVCGLPFKKAFELDRAVPGGEARIPVTIDSEDACTLYRGLEVSGTTIVPSPMWVRTRLAACGMRAINSVVDVTNLVLLELGQPLHAFDADRLEGPAIYVRLAEKAEPFETLDGEELQLEEGDVVICDDGGPVALGGVMGGASTAVNDDTRDLFLEAAVFPPGRIRRTSRRFGLVTESSYRFERGIDGGQVEQALVRAAELIVELGGGTIAGGMARAGQEVARPEPIRLRTDRMESVLGSPVERARATDILIALGAEVKDDRDALLTTPPTHRHDLRREIDLIEEVARIEGYDRVPLSLPVSRMERVSQPPSFDLARRLRVQLSAGGLCECVTLSFCSRHNNEIFPGLHGDGTGSVHLVNPLRSDEAEMRRSLLPSLIGVYRTNARSGAGTVDLFCLGRTFAAGDPPLQIEALAGLFGGPRRARGPGSAGPATFWDAKGVVERAVGLVAPEAEIEWVPCADRREYHPKACARVLVAGRSVGYLGTVHPLVAEQLEISEEICMFEVDTRCLLEYAPAHRGLRPIGRFPSSSRDVSLLVARDMLAAEVVTAVEGLGETLIERVTVFDEYVGEGITRERKALAFSIVYRSPERTLTDEEVASVHDRVVNHIVEQLDVEVRA